MSKGRKALSPYDIDLRKVISSNLKRLTKTRGLTQMDLAEKTGIPQSTLSGYFAERSTINFKNLEIVANFFKVDKSEIDPRYGNNGFQSGTVTHTKLEPFQIDIKELAQAKTEAKKPKEIDLADILDDVTSFGGRRLDDSDREALRLFLMGRLSK
ncbi:helix-turn-helix domain-containing protein [Enterococcus sp.]|uniref:helix-turn-helix domain-containing protein n=1 Tax=Enterococcus sp. TaxID=35783 RepID=UPI003C7843FA